MPTSSSKSTPLRHRRRVDRRDPFEPAVKILEAHGQDAAVEIAQVIGQAAVVGVGEPFERKLAVAAERALAHEVIAETPPPRTSRSAPSARRRCPGSCSVSEPRRSLRSCGKRSHGRRRFCGSGSPADMSIAGQSAQWNRVMSLPMTCTLAGQSRSNRASSVP